MRGVKVKHLPCAIHSLQYYNDEKILDAIQKGGATKIFHKLSEGLEHFIKRDVKKSGAIVSGGEMQKIAVSRAHMSDKDILTNGRSHIRS